MNGSLPMLFVKSYNVYIYWHISFRFSLPKDVSDTCPGCGTRVAVSEAGWTLTRDAALPGPAPASAGARPGYPPALAPTAWPGRVCTMHKMSWSPSLLSSSDGKHERNWVIPVIRDMWLWWYWQHCHADMWQWHQWHEAQCEWQWGTSLYLNMYVQRCYSILAPCLITAHALQN